MPHRPDQVASIIQRAVQTVLGRGLSDPRIRGLVSVTKVQVDQALSQAAVYVSVLPAEHAVLALQGLQHAAPRIQNQIAKSVQLRRMPRLSFHLDESIKKQAEFDAALAEARGDGNGPTDEPDARSATEESSP
ncbi:MAG: 30S ribosome-binding factor RbfA [Planctomycetota bacterium]|jgi:ribosome-binding factor A